jgi:thimet oligopeptidase
MPVELIEKIQANKNFSSGNFVLNQTFFAQNSLDYFKPSADKDVKNITRHLYQIILKNSVFVEENNFYASFGHLTEYGAAYYGYLWSRVFALDMFNEIKKYGLLNVEIGKKYIAAILSPGGSKDPNELLKDFLGREPNQEAFFRDLGI